MRSRALLSICALSLAACAGSNREPPMMPAEARALPDRPRAGNDDFWRAHAWSVENRPESTPPRSISLGYISDAPLEGGVTRDSPMPPRAPRDTRGPTSWQEYVNAPSWLPSPYASPTTAPGRRRGCPCERELPVIPPPP